MTLPDGLVAALSARYTIERELGRGGMATVYLAHDIKHGRQVAIKVLRPELAAAIGAERFLAEIRTTANLRHPHILPLYDSGEAGTYLYYVMPFVEGVSLRDRLDHEKQLPVEEARRIAIEVSDALSYAHVHSVVHRDIKPENILLESEHAVVADFGIAKALDLAGGDTLTQSGVSIGTPQYMSPEQAAGDKNLDGRSDIYALGCVCYEMLAGQPPFMGPTTESVVRQHMIADPRPVSHLRPAVPAALADAVQRALAKAPADRYSTVRQFADALQPGSKLAGPASQLAPRRGIGRSSAWVAVVFGLALLVTFGSRLIRGRPPIVQLGRRFQVTIDPGLELDPALSSDGRFVAYSAPSGALMVRQADGGDPIRVLRSGDVRGRWPVWSPDGRWLVFVSPRGIETVSAFGGAPRLLSPATPERGVALAPDGRAFAFVSHDSLLTRTLDSGTVRLVTVGREVHSPSWSPDGRWIAVVSGNIQFVKWSDLGNAAPSSIQIVPANGGEPTRLSDDRSLNVSPVWISARTLLYISDRDGGRDIYEQALSPSGKPAGRPVRLTTGLNPHGIAISRDGRRLAYSAFTETSNVWSVPIPERGSVSISDGRPVTAGNQVIENLDVSRDRQWLAFASDRNGVFQIYRQHLGEPTAPPEQVTTDTAGAWWGSWSPDDKEIAFHRFRGERRLVFVVPAEGGVLEQVTDGSQDERSPEWSPDGRQLLLLANWGIKGELHLVTRGADHHWSAPRNLPIVIGTDTIRAGISAWSPDGRLLACGCGPGGLVVVPVPDGPSRRLPSAYSSAGWAFPQWSADGQTIYHLTEDSGRVVGVVAVPLSGAPPRLIVRFDDPARPWHRFGFRVREGEIYADLGDRQSDIWVAEIKRQ